MRNTIPEYKILQMRKQFAQDYSDRLYTNIKALSKIRGIPLGIFESIVDVSQGYFSRRHVYAFNVIFALSEYLGVPVEDMVKKDYTKELEICKKQKRIQALQDKINDIESDIKVIKES